MEKRRSFLKKISGLTASIMVPVSSISFAKSKLSDKWGYVLPKRKLGKTGVEVTMLGVGEDITLDGPPKRMPRQLLRPHWKVESDFLTVQNHMARIPAKSAMESI
jgi:hypothetical protein